MKFLIATFISIVVATVSYIALDQNMANKIKVVSAADSEEEYLSKKLSLTAIIVISLMLSVVAFISTLKIMTKVSNPVGIIKMLLALVCMGGAACFDFREKRIPNIFPVSMAFGAVVLLALGFCLKQNGAISHITTSVVASIGCAIVLVLAAILTKQGIGAGDIKLISALALLTGVYSIIGVLFFGAISCSLFAIVSYIIKRKETSKSVPFGPFLFLGYIIMLFTINF
jgi:Flp pilus assembly protein protease CpaA